MEEFEPKIFNSLIYFNICSISFLFYCDWNWSYSRYNPCKLNFSHKQTPSLLFVPSITSVHWHFSFSSSSSRNDPQKTGITHDPRPFHSAYWSFCRLFTAQQLRAVQKWGSSSSSPPTRAPFIAKLSSRWDYPMKLRDVIAQQPLLGPFSMRNYFLAAKSKGSGACLATRRWSDS